MGISPWYKTSTPTAPTWTISLVPDSGYLNVSGLVVGNFSLLLHNLDTGVETTGQGTFSNITAAVVVQSGSQTIVVSPASVQYQHNVADVVVGRYRCFVLITFSNGVEPFLIQEDWRVEAL